MPDDAPRAETGRLAGGPEHLHRAARPSRRPAALLAALAVALVAIVGFVFGIARQAAADVEYTTTVNWALYTITDTSKTPDYGGTSDPKLLVLSTNALGSTYDDEKYGDDLSRVYWGTWNTSSSSDYPDWYRGSGSAAENYQRSIYAVRTASDSDTITPHYATQLFTGCYELVDISDLSGWDMSGALGLYYTFGLCRSLEDISALEKWDIGQVTTTQYTFMGCQSLSDISALKGWDTSHVTNMSFMFAGCEKLESVGALAEWKTGAVTNMSSMFGINTIGGASECSSLAKLDGLEKWDVSNVTNMNGMFLGCSSLNDVTALENWLPQSVKIFSGMFRECTSLGDISALSNWNTGSATDMGNMFWKCSSLKTVGPLNWDTGHVTYMSEMFRDCTALKTVDGLGTWDVSSATNLSYLFFNDTDLERVVIWDWGAGNKPLLATCNANYMFGNCTNLKTIYCAGSWNVQTSNGRQVFDGCSEALKSQSSGVAYENLKYNSAYCNPTTGYFTNSIIPPVDSDASLTFNGASQVSGLEAAQWTGTNYYTFTQAVNGTQTGTQYDGTIGSDGLSVSGIHAGTYDVTASIDFENAVPATLKGKIGFEDAPADSITPEGSTTTVHFTIAKATPTISILDASGSGPAGALTLDPGESVTVRLEVMYANAEGEQVAYGSPFGSISPTDFTIANADGLETSFKEVEGSDDVVELTITAPAGTSGSKTVGIGFDGNGDLEATNASQGVTVLEPAPGNLTIKKTVDPSGVAGVLAAGRKFTFIVELKDPNGSDFTGELSGLQFLNGSATFQLANGGSQEITGIPAGSTYTVSEVEQLGYSTSSTGETGTIEAGATQTAAFTNTYQPATLTINKSVVDGNAEGSFEFQVVVEDDLLDGQFNATGIDGGKLQFTGGVSDKFTLSLSEGKGVASIEGLPVGASFSVTETRQTGYTPTFSGDATSDADVWSATGTLQANTTVNVTNTYAGGDLTVSKAITGEDADKDKRFGFTVTVRPPKGQTVNGPRGATQPGTGASIVFEDNVATFTLSNDESVTFKSLPAGSTVIVDETPDGSGSYIASPALSQRATIEDGVTKTVAFTNRYQKNTLTLAKQVVDAAPWQSGRTYVFTVTQVGHDDCSGHDHGGMTFVDGKATVELKPTAENHWQASETATHMPEGTYTVKEEGYYPEGGSIDDLVPSSDEYVTTATVDDVSEDLIDNTVSGTFRENEEVRFTNTYKTGGISVSNSVSGGLASDAARSFNFEVRLSGDHAYQVTGNYGGIAFNAGVATFSLADGDRVDLNGLPAGLGYTVTETGLVGGGSLDAYATTITGGTVNSEARGSSGTIPGDGTSVSVAFTNVYKTGSLTVAKTVTGGGIEDQKFAITVSPVDPTTSMRGYSYSIEGSSSTIDNDSVTLMLSGGQTATFSELPAGDYLVSELDYTSYGYGTRYSGGTETEGGVTASVPYEGSAAITVTNTFGGGALALTKQVTGTDSTRDFTFTLQAGSTINGPRPVTYKSSPADASRLGAITFTNGVATLTLTGGETATIAGLPIGATVTISEAAVPGYEASISGNVTETGAGVATATIAGAATQNVTFTNAYTTGTLSLEKAVLVGSGDAIPPTPYGFTVNFTNASDFEELGTITGAVSGTASSRSVTFEGGSATVSLQNGEKLTIPNLPEGLAYTITETTVGESITAWQSDDAQAEISARAVSGTIASPATAITCNNILGGNHKLPSVYENANLLVGQEITYTIAWENATSEAQDVVIYDPICMGFTFKEASGEGSYDPSGELPADVAKPYDYHGVVTWDLGRQAKGQRGSVTVTLEVNADAVTAGSVENVAVVSIDNEATVVETPALVVDDPGSLTVAKTLAPGVSAGGPFTFKVTFTDINGHPYSRAISYEFTGTGTGSLDPIDPPATGMTMPDADGSISFTLEAGASVKFGNLLRGTTFTAQETESGGLVPSWTVDGTSGSAGTIESNETAALVCTNARPGPTPPGPVQPDNPDNPDNPDDPDTPDNPDNPDTPDNPDNPSNPDTPENPSNPDGPGGQPGAPGTGSDSSEGTTTSQNPNALPKTGDDNPLVLPTALMATGIALLGLTAVLMRPRRASR